MSLTLESVCLKLQKASFVMLYLAHYRNCLIFQVAQYVSCQVAKLGLRTHLRFPSGQQAFTCALSCAEL